MYMLMNNNAFQYMYIYIDGYNSYLECYVKEKRRKRNKINH